MGGVDIHPGEYGKGGHYILDSRVNLLLGRFEVFKRSFTGTESFDLTLPRGVVVNSADQVESEARQLHISSYGSIPTYISSVKSDCNRDFLKEMFRKSTNGVRQLITQQIVQVEETVVRGVRCRVSVSFLTLPLRFKLVDSMITRIIFQLAALLKVGTCITRSQSLRERMVTHA